MKPIFLISDLCMYLLCILLVLSIVWNYKKVHLRRIWRNVFKSKLAVASAVVLVLFFLISLLDSIHFQINGQHQIYSVLDLIMQPHHNNFEKSYSAPFALHSYTKAKEPLKFTGAHLKQLNRSQWQDVLYSVFESALITLIFSIVFYLVYLVFYNLKSSKKVFSVFFIPVNKEGFPHRVLLFCIFIMFFFVVLSFNLAKDYHVFGTTKVGVDVFYQAIKSIRTGVIIGTITTLFMMPFAIIFGIAAGYYGGIVDDVIQYVYTTLSSIPGVLLIAASILSLQVFINNHPELFPSLIQRADARLLALCIILGITSWTSLCRLLRAETLKVREYDFVKAAKVLGTNSGRIITKHILPNVLHIIIISVILDFSALVLAEAVLSYVGVGVDPTMFSWGNMINSARLELARSPAVWWPLLAAFVLMFLLVLTANIFSEKVRESFDPRNL